MPPDMTIDHETSPAEHAEFAPPEAWDAIAAGYAEHVAPGEQSLSAAALRLVGLSPARRSSTSPPVRAVWDWPPHVWVPRCWRPTGRRRWWPSSSRERARRV